MSTSTDSLQDYTVQLNKKVEETLVEFAEFGVKEIPSVYASPPTGFRMRAEFKAWHDNGAVNYAMFKPGEKKQAYIIEEFNNGSKTMQRMMPALLERLNNSPILAQKLFQIEFLTSSLGEILITLIYKKPLDEAWNEAASQLSDQLGAHILGRSRKQKVVITQDYIHEQFSVDERTYRYKQIEGSFTQPNAHICQSMLQWTSDQIEPASAGDLLELYCGNGNFTLPLAAKFNRVLATEVSKTSVNAALYNRDINNVKNVAFARLSSEEFTQALKKVRPFNRLRDIDLDSYNFNSVFVDPPRAGLDAGTLELIRRFGSIIYISCNPATLRANLRDLATTHRVKSIAFFDQFPYTPHRECGVVLEKL